MKGSRVITELKNLVEEVCNNSWLQQEEIICFNNFLTYLHELEFNEFDKEQAYEMCSNIKFNLRTRQKIKYLLAAGNIVCSALGELRNELRDIPAWGKRIYNYAKSPIEYVDEISKCIEHTTLCKKAEYIANLEKVKAEIAALDIPLFNITQPEGVYKRLVIGVTNKNPYIDRYIQKMNDALSAIEDSYLTAILAVEEKNRESELVLTDIFNNAFDEAEALELINELKAIRAERRYLKNSKAEIKTYKKSVGKIYDKFKEFRSDFYYIHCSNEESTESGRQTFKNMAIRA